jgi:hypothetical protein
MAYLRVIFWRVLRTSFNRNGVRELSEQVKKYQSLLADLELVPSQRL